MNENTLRDLFKNLKYDELYQVKTIVEEEIQKRERLDDYKTYYDSFRHYLCETFLTTEVDRGLPPWHKQQKATRRLFAQHWRTALQKLNDVGLHDTPRLHILVIRMVSTAIKKPDLRKVCIALDEILDIFETHFPRYINDKQWIEMLNHQIKDRTRL